MRPGSLHHHGCGLTSAHGGRYISTLWAAAGPRESRVKAWVWHLNFEGETIMRALLLAALAVLTLSVATAAFAGGHDGGGDAMSERSQ